MSLTVTKASGVTVFTLTSDPKSHWPPLCQILKGLCYSPVCCSVSQHLKKVQRTSLSVLGALHIMIGLLSISLALIMLSSASGVWWEMYETWFPHWLGGLFVAFGIVCILSEKYPSPCLVYLSVILNLAGVAFAITAIVLYSINMAEMDVWWSCNRTDDDWNWEYHGDTTPTATTTPSAQQQYVLERCLRGREVILMLMRSINAVLIVLSVLELCVTISSAVLGIKALRSSQKEPNKSAEDPETYKPLLEGVTTQPAA